MTEPNLLGEKLADVEMQLSQFQSQVNDDDLYDEPNEELVDKAAAMTIEEPKVEPAALSKPQPERQTEQFPLTTQTTFATEESSAFEAVQPTPMAPMTYEMKVNSAAISAERKQELLTLGQMGFQSFDTNMALLNKYKDLQLVANTLLSGGLNESAINEIYLN